MLRCLCFFNYVVELPDFLLQFGIGLPLIFQTHIQDRSLVVEFTLQVDILLDQLRDFILELLQRSCHLFYLYFVLFVK